MRRLECLDGLRGVLSCYVMASHMAPFAALPAVLATGLSHGGAAVDVFFILSGLVIVRSLEALGWRARPFLIARIGRIFPAYLAVLALAIMVQPLPSGFESMPWIGEHSPARSIWSDGWPREWGPELLAHLTMTHGLFPAAALPNAWVSFLGAAWSLSTEWQFYLLVLVAGSAGCPAARSPRVLWRLVAGFLALAAAGWCWRMSAPPEWQFSRAFLPNKAHYFALGIASAGLLAGAGWRSYSIALGATSALSGLDGLEKLLPPLLWTLCLAAEHGATSSPAARRMQRLPGGSAGSGPADGGDPNGPERGRADPDLVPRKLGHDPAIPSSMTTRCVRHVHGIPQAGLGLLRRILSSRVPVWFGGLSYAIYLANEPVQKVLGVALARMTDGNAWLFTLLWCPLALALPVILAALLHHWVELPAMRWSRALAHKASISRRFGILAP